MRQKDQLYKLIQLAAESKAYAKSNGFKSGSVPDYKPLADYLNKVINGDSGLKIQLANAAGISISTFKQILAGTIFCPPLKRLEGFASIIIKRGL